MKKTSTVQLVRNATLKIRYAGHTMLIDPVLADKGTLISALGVNKTPRVQRRWIPTSLSYSARTKIQKS